MIKLILMLLIPFRTLFNRIGVNYEQLVAIVALKLKVDSRIDEAGRSGKKTSNKLLKQCILMSIIGGFSFGTYLLQGTLSSGLLLLHSFMMLVLITNFLMGYSQLLFNKTDDLILSRMPITPKTMLTAKLAAMLSYMLFLSLSISVIPVLILLFWKGIGATLAFLISILLNTVFSLLLANTVYLSAINFISGEKVQRIISYVNISLTLLALFGFQIINHVNQDVNLDILQNPGLWIYFTPPAYFMAMTEFVLHPSLYLAILILIGLFIPCILLGITLKYLAANFTKRIKALDNEVASSSKNVRKKEKTASRLVSLFSRQSIEQTGFLLTWKLTSNNLKFKQAVLPMIICSFAMVLYPCYRSFSSMNEAASIFSMVYPLYFTLLMVPMLIENITHSEGANLLWIYQARPLAKPGLLILGAFKAVFIKFYVPIFILLAGIVLVLTGIAGLDDIILIFSFSTLFCLINILLTRRIFPFSKEKSDMDTSGNTIKMMLIMLTCLILCATHYLLSRMPYGIIIAIPLCWVLIFMCCRKVANTPWKKITSFYK